MPTKKVATADASKKTVARVVKKKPEKGGVSIFVYASNEQSFWTVDGQILNSLIALRDALSGMSKAVFTHHVNTKKNDFAEWVDVVLFDTACASDLRKAKTAASAHTVVVNHLKRYGR